MLGAPLGDAGDEALGCRDETALLITGSMTIAADLAGQRLGEEQPVEPGEGEADLSLS